VTFATDLPYVSVRALEGPFISGRPHTPTIYNCGRWEWEHIARLPGSVETHVCLWMRWLELCLDGVMWLSGVLTMLVVPCVFVVP